MAWEIPENYASPSWRKIIISMQGVNGPSVTGTYFAMEPINLGGKKPFLSPSGLGETDTDAPVTPGQARKAFDLRWVHDSLVDVMAEIAKSDGRDYEADI